MGTVPFITPREGGQMVLRKPGGRGRSSFLQKDRGEGRRKKPSPPTALTKRQHVFMTAGTDLIRPCSAARSLDHLISLFKPHHTCTLSRAWLLATLGRQPTRLLCPWDSPGKNTGVGCHFLLQEIFLTQGLNLPLLHCRWILYC